LGEQQDTFVPVTASERSNPESEEMLMPELMDRLLPKVISPRTHAVIDYIQAGANFAAGALFRRRSPRASNAAFWLGASILANALMTDYPLGVFRGYRFRVHGALDYGVAAASEAMPRLLGIEDTPEARYFKLQGTSEWLIAGLTDYNDTTGARRRSRLFPHRRAA
jgi:hypothetical protein